MQCFTKAAWLILQNASTASLQVPALVPTNQGIKQ